VRFAIPAPALLAAVHHASKLYGDSKPAFAGLRFRRVDDVLYMDATDLQIGMTVALEGGALEGLGSFMVGADAMRVAVDAMRGKGNITVEQDGAGGRVEVSAGRAKYRLNPGDAGALPVPQPVPTATATIEAARLDGLIRRAAYAVSADRSELMGVFFEAGVDVLTVAATDGHRMALAESVQPPGEEIPPLVDTLVPTHAIRAIRRLVADDAETGHVGVARSPGRTHWSRRFAWGSITLSVLHDANLRFPPYRQVIPEYAKTAPFQVKREVLLGMVERAALMVKHGMGVTIVLEPDPLLAMKVDGADGAYYEETDEDVLYAGGHFEATFNPRYFREWLEAGSGEYVLLHPDRDMSYGSLVLTDGPHYRAVLMPMRS